MRLTNRSRALRAVMTTLVVAVGLSLALWLMLITGEIRLPKRMVLRAAVPHSSCAVELWEKPDLNFIAWEYQTWLVVRYAKEVRWNLIDDECIRFTDTALLFSPSLDAVRVEVTGSGGAHMVAEYDLKRQRFRAEGGPSVRDERGWTVLAAARVHR